MKLMSYKSVRHIRAWVAVALVVTIVFSPMLTAKAADASAHSEYQQYVHTYLNSSKGNWTSVDKPMFPVYFNDTQIAIGATWSIIEPLAANHNYHVYCYGKWVNNGSAPKTDYDIYVFNPQGVQESEHTEAAGLPEHLGTRVNDTFFAPAVTGDYKFVIANDARQSNDTEQATFMAIENIECDKWYTQGIEGKSQDNIGVFSTSWAYEFVTDKPQIEVYVKVPDTLDMYETRLYVTSDPQSLAINGAPLPWEPGLYGNLTGDVGGYSLDSDNYRGAAYASCEYRGQDMLLKYSSAATGKTLYHLVLIGEAGAGNIDFLVKTRFGDACLAPANVLGRVYPWNETTVAYASNATNLEGAVMDYSTDHWNSTQSTEMKTENQTCSAVIPRQKTGTIVEYKIRANDTLMNALQAEGNFTVKQIATLNITVVREKVRIGENITVNGMLTSQNGSVPVTVKLMNSDETDTVESLTSKDGTFTVNFRANSTGVWAVQATFAGSYAVYPCDSAMLTAKVEEQPFYVKNGTLIGGGFFGLIIVSGAVFYIRKRRQ